MVDLKSIPIITLDELHEILSYEPSTGLFRWTKWINGRPPIGTVAGFSTKNGYWAITLFQRRYYAHRLAWFYIHGTWPSNLLDHIDGNKLNNRLCNLREADVSQNSANSKKRCTNTTGYKGVFLDKRDNVYYARTKHRGEYINFGWFKDPYEAHLAYIAGVKAIHGEFARWE